MDGRHGQLRSKVAKEITAELNEKVFPKLREEGIKTFLEVLGCSRCAHTQIRGQLIRQVGVKKGKPLPAYLATCLDNEIGNNASREFVMILYAASKVDVQEMHEENTRELGERIKDAIEASTKFVVDWDGSADTMLLIKPEGSERQEVYLKGRKDEGPDMAFLRRLMERSGR